MALIRLNVTDNARLPALSHPGHNPVRGSTLWLCHLTTDVSWPHGMEELQWLSELSPGRLTGFLA
jgi:hypothetical protein